MSLDTECVTQYNKQIVVSRTSCRRLRVRHSYPQSLIELVGHLRTRMPAREIAAVLDVPLSSVYRWAPIRDLAATTLLISRCEAEGFDVPPSIVEILQSGSTKSPSPTDTRSFPNRRRENTTLQSKLKAARSMIESDYFRAIDSRILAATAGLSRFRFIHAFTATYEISPHQYLLRTRIAAAKRLLAMSRETIDVIASATGFRSGACLNRAFTRLEGHCISRFCRIIGTGR